MKKLRFRPKAKPKHVIEDGHKTIKLFKTNAKCSLIFFRFNK